MLALAASDRWNPLVLAVICHWDQRVMCGTQFSSTLVGACDLRLVRRGVGSQCRIRVAIRGRGFVRGNHSLAEATQH